MALETWLFDASEYITEPEGYAAYLQAAFEERDPAGIIDAIGVVARAKGMTEIAREAGVSRPALYRALTTKGNPEFATVLKVLQSLGVSLTPVATAPAAAE